MAESLAIFNLGPTLPDLRRDACPLDQELRAYLTEKTPAPPSLLSHLPSLRKTKQILQNLEKNDVSTLSEEHFRALHFLHKNLHLDFEAKAYLQSCVETQSFQPALFKLKSETMADLIQDYLDLFGHRTNHEFILESLDSSEDPIPLFRVLLNDSIQFEGALTSDSKLDEAVKSFRKLKKEFLSLGEQLRIRNQCETKDSILYLTFHEIEQALVDSKMNLWQTVFDRRVKQFYLRENSKS